MSKLAYLFAAQYGREDGQSLVEYGLILALVVLVGLAGVTVMAGGVDGMYDVVKAIPDAMANVLGG